MLKPEAVQVKQRRRRTVVSHTRYAASLGGLVGDLVFMDVFFKVHIDATRH